MKTLPDRASSRRRGFTLLEVLVALALLATALTALSDLIGGALRNHAYARDLSVATLLARGKMAELEQKYEDEGFKDSDQEEAGDFAREGAPTFKWRAVLVKPDPQLSPEQILSMVGGQGSGLDVKKLSQYTPEAMMAKAAAAGEGSSPVTSQSDMAAAMTTGMIQAQFTAFGQVVKQAIREVKLTVSWPDGKTTRKSFTVTTHLLVLNPRAPGGARGDDPDVPPNAGALDLLGGITGGNK